MGGSALHLFSTENSPMTYSAVCSGERVIIGVDYHLAEPREP